MYTLGVAAHGLPLLSQSARRRVLEEARLHIMRRYTNDPAMPGPLRSLIGAMVRIFWVDIVLEVEADDRKDAEELDGDNEAELAAAPAIACGMLQVLVVEARNLAPVHGIGTNPYVRAVLGQQVRRSWTAWSNLRPAWNCIMDFSVVSLSGTLEIEVMSQAPLFGGDTRLGFVSIPVKDIVSKARSSSASTPHLSYRCEALGGAKHGELVLILDYRPLLRELPRSRFLDSMGRTLRRWATRFRAFFLYHYWPCDKSMFQMYLKEPVDISLLLISLSPFAPVRAAFYTVLLICLCTRWPPDEHQIVQFILAFKGLAVFTDGTVQMLYGLLAYYTCARAGTCATGGTPGSGIGTLSIAFDLYQEILVWCVCFFLLPKTVPYRLRSGASADKAPAGAASSKTPTAAGSVRSGVTDCSPPASGAHDAPDAKRGGRMKALLKYDLLCFVVCLGTFAGLSARDAAAVGVDEARQWRILENFFWARTLYGLLMFPFLFLLHPQINRLLTHSTPTGYTCLGTLRRHNTRLRPRRRPKFKESANAEEAVAADAGAAPAQRAPPTKEGAEPRSTPVSAPSAGSGPASGAASLPAGPENSSAASPMSVLAAPRSVDPVEDLKAAIRWFPGGSLALCAGSCGLNCASSVTKFAGSVVSLEIRTASAAVSLGLRAVDAGVSTAMHVAQCVPGSDIALQAGEAVLDLARRTSCATVERSVGVARQLPGGDTVLDTVGQLLREVGFLAAAAESPGLAASVGIDANATPLLQVGTERAEALKLEAAARLAEMLSRAERLAEREAAEAFERVRPEIGKISQALQARSRGFRAHLERAYGACESLGFSVAAYTLDIACRLPAAGEAFLRVFDREWADLQEETPGRDPGWRPLLEAYSRMVCSSVCEAFLELRPQLRAGRDVRGVPGDADADADAGVPAALPQPDSDSAPSLRARRNRSHSPAWRAYAPERASAARRSASCSPTACVSPGVPESPAESAGALPEAPPQAECAPGG